MCGIAGILYFNQSPGRKPEHPGKMQQLLYHRGPDHQASYHFKNCSLYHSRLSIVDVSSASNQPFLNTNKTHGLVFNGEIFNYKDFFPELNSDVETLFKLLETEGSNCLHQLNGFFAFAFYEEEKNTLVVARDRFGVKPLYYYCDEEKFAFASELKPLLELAGKLELDHEAIYSYFRLNYFSGEKTVFKNVYRLLPGRQIEVRNGQLEISRWYTLPVQENKNSLGELLHDSVRLRLNADVPVGTFLSGGMDSSIISALAKQYKPDLHTFSIGFKGNEYFDETQYAELAAKHIGSNHHVFKLSEDDFIHNIQEFLNGIDEPFADSSAFNFYMLCKYTKQHVKVALSGDGADELFKGYNKHKAAFLKSTGGNAMLNLASALLPLLGTSRNSKLGNLARQAKKFRDIKHLNGTETFKYLAGISQDKDVQQLLKKSDQSYFNSLFTMHNPHFAAEDQLDLNIVLADDMLVKADRFSMQHGIEIRNPFLDYRVVEFAMNLDKSEKISKAGQKLILRKEFESLLPPAIFERSKKGFELPLQNWLSGQLNFTIKNNWLNKEKINSEGFLNYSAIENLLRQLHSKNPGDSAAKLWAVIIFESWLQNFKDYIKN